MSENGLCYRCEHRAKFHETKSGPRCQCGEVGSAVCRCYMYKPVLPFILIKDKTDVRPQFGPAFISSRSGAGGIPEMNMRIFSEKTGPVLYWEPKGLDQQHIEAQKVMSFFDNHPALGSPIFDFFSLMFDMSIQKVCRRGRVEGDKRVYYTSQDYKRFKKEFDEEFKEYTPEQLKKEKPLISIDVPYEKFYGEPWTYDHIEYWGELSFVMYFGKLSKKQMSSEEANQMNWERCSGVSASGHTFQDMIIDLGKEFKKVFGDFESDDFLTKAEKKNNEDLMPFFFKDNKDGTSTMVRNPKYMHVGPGEINRRWLKWFSKTPYAKKNWKNNIESIFKGNYGQVYRPTPKK